VRIKRIKGSYPSSEHTQTMWDNWWVSHCYQFTPLYSKANKIVDEPAFGHQILFQIWVKQFTMCEVYLD